MEQALLRQVATAKFWDTYAKWYKLWIGHTNYHERIVDVLMTMTKPGLKVLDIGAGNGILSIPLYARGCDVTALEPSIGMRNLLYEEAFKNGIDGLTVDNRMWEEVPCYEFLDYDLILACNTLHLIQIGFEEAITKIFRTRPRNVFLTTEFSSQNIGAKCQYGDYTKVFTKSFEVDSSYAYHHFNQMVEHWSFIKGRLLQSNETHALRERIFFEGSHLWMKDTAQVMMCWWKRDGQK